ncbi:MAG: glycosyltransferase [Bacteroidetes bacterium]|nr:glycosyltransferase [Bacteroidota bacterium]
MYAALILFYRAGWNALPAFSVQKDYNPKTKVSIIIPARNEATNIGRLLKNVTSQYYPHELIEIIVVDDHSEDETSQIASSFSRVKCISLAKFTEGKILNAYKKKAIEIGIAQSTGELIITTDADCAMENYWLLNIVAYYETYYPALIASPVLFNYENSSLSVFQHIDFTMMQGITGAIAFTKSGTLCNGANLAFTRSAFESVNGYVGIDDIASGDDMLLMYKIEKQFPKRTAYLKCLDAVVTTYPMPNLKSFLLQRQRWASKATKFNDKRIQAVLLLVYVFNLLFPILFVMGFFNSIFFTWCVALLLAKTIIEFSFWLSITSFFKLKRENLYFALLQIAHIAYIIYSGLQGQHKKYVWKDRTVQ